LHSDETGHGKFTGEVIVANLRELGDLTRVDAGASHEESADSLSSGSSASNRGEEDEDSVYISLDAQNIIGRDGPNNQGIVGLINILKQLRIISEKADRTFQLETIAPPFGDFKKFSDRIKEFSRLILVTIWPEDKELDDYLVASLASAHDGLYVSNDKSMHKHIGKDDDWGKMHRIGFKRLRITEDLAQEATFATKSIELLFPDGPLSDTYNELKDKQELFVKTEEWELQYLEKFDEKRKRKLVPKYVCPVCDEQFQSWNKMETTKLQQHMLETGHACRICEDCSTVLPSANSFSLHKKQTGHENYSGENFMMSELKISKEMREEARKKEAAEAAEGKKRAIEEAVKEIYGGMTETDLEKLVIKCYNEILGEDVSHMLKVSLVEGKGVVCHFPKRNPSLRAKFIGDKADTVNQVRKLLSEEIEFENPRKMYFFVDEDSE
jgi:hypothetical protein